jgi:glycosyltransferase involved in cell wall biosynthesis
MQIGADLRFTAAAQMGTGSYAETTVRDLASALASKDALWGFAYNDLARTLPNVALRPVMVHPPLGGASAALAERLLWDAAVARLQLDVFFAPTGLAPLVKTCAAVITIHDLLFEMEPSCFSAGMLAYLKKEIPRSVRAADRIIAVSEHTRETLIRLYNVPQERIRVISQRLKDIFECPARPTESVLKKLGIQSPYVLTLSNHAPHKNTLFALEVFAHWRKTRSRQEHLVIAGGGPSPAPPVDLQQAISAQCLADCVEVLGRIEEDDLPALYAGAKAFLYPSRYEGWGLPPLEAIAVGTPAIVSDRGALPEAVGGAAIILPLGSVETWSDALERCVSGRTEGLSEAMSRRRAALFERKGRAVLEVLHEAHGVWSSRLRASVALPADPEERPSVVCRGDWFSPSGFGETARLTFRALESAGLRPQALSVPKDSIQVPSLWPQACHATGKNADIILHLLPPDMYDFSLPGRHYGYFLWETDRLDPAHSPLHQRWAESLNRLDEVWIPSQFLENVLRNSGVTRPVRLVPYPIDTRQYPPQAKRYRHVELPEGFDAAWTVFLYVGTWDARKRPDILVRAFCRAFSDRDQALLIVKSYRYGENRRDRQELFGLLAESYQGTAHVRLIADVLSDKDMAELYQSATVFVTASRGEGYCLPAVSAMSCGAPVMAVRWSAFEDYPVLAVKHQLRNVSPEVRLPGYTSEMQWAEVDEEDLTRQLAWAHQNRPALREVGNQARKWIEEHSSFEVMARVMRQALLGERPSSGPGETRRG